MPLRGIFLLVLFVPSLPVCFFSPFYGLVVWTIIAFLNPQWYAWWAAYLIPWALATAIPTLAGLILFHRDWQGIKSREGLLLLALWIWFTITSVISTSTPLFIPHAEDTWARWQFVTKILLMAAVTMVVVNSFARLRTLVIVIACCLGFYVAKAFPFLLLTGGNYKIYGPEKSMLGDNNDFGLALNMTIPFFFFLAQSESKPWLKRVFWCLFLMAIPTVFFTYSRGALMGLVAVLGLMLLRLKQRIVLVPVALLGIVFAMLFAPASWKERMDPTREGAIDKSAESRFNAWTFAWRLTMDYPLAGGGFDTFTPELFNRYAPHPTDVHGPHSIYFGILAEHGFIGLLLYLALVVSCFGSIYRIRKWARFQGDEAAQHYADMFRFSLIGFLVSGAFLGRAYFDYFYTIIAGVAILKRVCFVRWAEEEQEDSGDEKDEEELSAPLAGEVL
jgi:probable O-glycosylation ligase (exosortase A-associated)